MSRKQIGGLIIAAVLFIAVGVTSVLTHSLVNHFIPSTSMMDALTEDTDYSLPAEDYIAIVEIAGTIQAQTQSTPFETAVGYQHTTTMDYINRLINDPNNKGILLYVDSPGGTVYESEEIYDKLREYADQTKRPIWTYMAHYAASGGYMASVASDRIFANKNTTTGSIGVIMSGYDMTGLYEKLGIRYISITSGKNKDSSRMTDEQIALYKEQVDEYYEAFVKKVADGRGMTTDEVKPLADGRVYTASQALKNGLIDEISTYEEMRAKMEEQFGVHTFYSLPAEDNLLASLFAKIEDVTPKSEAQILTETADKMESGVFMYYADPLK